MLNRLKGYFNGLLHVMNFINSIIYSEFFRILSSVLFLLKFYYCLCQTLWSIRKSVETQDFSCWSTLRTVREVILDYLFQY